MHGRAIRSPRNAPQFFFKLATHQSPHTQAAQIIGIHRRIESVATNVRLGIHVTHPFHHRYRQPRCGMHGQMERDQIGGLHSFQRKRVHREVGAGHLMAIGAQQCCRGREAEWLSTQFVGGDEEDAHGYGCL